MALETVIVAGLLAAALAVSWRAAHLLRVWRRVRGPRLVACDDTGKRALVVLDVPHALATAFVADSPDVRIAHCSKWPACAACDRHCLPDALKDGNRVLRLVERWYTGRRCVYCARPIGAVQAFGQHAALLAADGMTREWSELPAEDLPEAFRHDRAVCRGCHVAQTLRRQRPDLITDRPWTKDTQSGRYQ